MPIGISLSLSLFLPVCLCVWESERPPVVSSCCLRGSQRLPPWNRRRRGTELGSDRPTKTPLQKLWGEEQEDASTENTHTALFKYYTDPLELSTSYLRGGFRYLKASLSGDVTFMSEKILCDILWVHLIELWTVALRNNGTVKETAGRGVSLTTWRYN